MDRQIDVRDPIDVRDLNDVSDPNDVRDLNDAWGPNNVREPMMSAISMIPDHFILPIKLDSLNSFPPYLVNIHLALPFDFFGEFGVVLLLWSGCSLIK